MTGEESVSGARPGSIRHLVDHLATWLDHRRAGIAWVEFEADAARDSAIQQIDAGCKRRGSTTTRLTVAQAAERFDWERLRDELEATSGIVHVAFSRLLGSPLAPPRDIREFGLALNLDRERIFSMGTQQIWWVPGDFGKQLRLWAPDFLSWVNIRFRLEEILPSRGIGDSDSAGLFLQHDHAEQRTGLRNEVMSPRVPTDSIDSDSAGPTDLVKRSADLSRNGHLNEALNLASEAVYKFRQASSASREAGRPGLAASLNNLATILRSMGQREEALERAKEATGIFRELAEQGPDDFLPDLGGSVNTLAIMLSDLGRREEALAEAEEAVRIRRQLAQQRPDAFLPDLGMSVNNLALRLSDLGRREEALAQAEEAVRIHRQLAQQRPDAFLPNLGTSVNNLATMLSDLGRREEALAQAEEAVRIRRQLAQQRPDAFLPDLGMSVNNLANRPSDLGRREEALAQAEEAVRIYRQLAQQRPDAFLPDLGMSVNNLANMLSDLGRREEALAQAEEAVRIYRQLAQQRPDAFLPDLARALAVRGQIIAEDRPDEAMVAFAEAIRLLTPFFSQLPEAHGPLMQAIRGLYVGAAQASGVAPDATLLGP